MRSLAVALASAWILPAGARAADDLAIGPVPDWVKPAPARSTPAEPDDAAVRILLADEQVNFDEGRKSVYTESVLRIQTPQGLAAGNISIAWRPETDVLTIHKVRIRRGEQVIDVLAAGQTFTVVRREANLESAMLDGVLTANIQPEGLQVGDTIELAATMTSSDPVLRGHVEQFSADWNLAPIDKARLRATWPAGMPIKVRRTAALPAVKTAKFSDTVSIELSLDDIQPETPPKGAPSRFQMGRLVEMTDFASWSEAAALMAPLYSKAATVPAQGALRTELDRIKSQSADAKVRAEAALSLVQDRIRYVALAMGDGGLVPADAETTWARRYGDCKGKTALLLGLLEELGIDAEPVAVSILFGDGLDTRLPMIGLFDHVLVRAVVDGETYWLDGTRTGDSRLDRLAVPAFGWGLPIVPNGAALVRMMPSPLATPDEEITIRIDAKAGLSIPAPARIETIVRGDAAISINLVFANLTAEARDRALRDYWRNQFDFIDVKSAGASFDEKAGEQRLSMEGLARMNWTNGRYKANGVHIGYKADFKRDEGRGSDAPFAVPYPHYSKTVETILLPPGFTSRSISEESNVDETIAGIEYRRRVSLVGDTFTVEKSERSIAAEFPARDAEMAEARLRELNEHSVYIHVPDGFRPTEKELAAVLDSEPKTASEFFNRGLALLDLGRFDDAISDFSRANELDPKNQWPLANRGLAHVWKGDADAANADLSAAAAIDPKNPVVFRARGLMALNKGAPLEAVAAFTTALSIEPENTFALASRASAHRAAGNNDAALADSESALNRDQRMIDMYLLRANIFRGKGDLSAAAAEAAAAAAANPENPYAHVISANVYSALGRRDEAMSEYDRALALKPEPYIYLNRSLHRPKSDIAGRKADLDAALAIDGEFSDAVSAKADLQSDTGDHVGAIKTYTAALKTSSDNVTLIAKRGVAYARSGDLARAEKDFEAARAKATEPFQFNEICWSKAIAGVALQSALADCNAALGGRPDNPAYLDSRGLVLLQLGRNDAAIADYDRALAQSPNMPTSLFGRAVARARKGDAAKSETDVAAALKADPDVRTEFEGYGVTF